MKIVLFEPQIPQNTGNVVRTCSVLGLPLILVEPLGFSLSDRYLKRAGLDYWEGVDVTISSTLDDLLKNEPGRPIFFSSKGKTLYTDFKYKMGDLLIFGSETHGLPDWVFEKYPDQIATLPMKSGARCLNLATTAGIASYEAMRQIGF